MFAKSRELNLSSISSVCDTKIYTLNEMYEWERPELFCPMFISKDNLYVKWFNKAFLQLIEGKAQSCIENVLALDLKHIEI